MEYGEDPNRYLALWCVTCGGHRIRGVEVVNGYRSKKTIGEHFVEKGFTGSGETASQIIIAAFLQTTEKEFLNKYG